MDEWYRVSQVAELLHVDRATVYRWIKERKILQKWIRTLPNGMIAVNGKGITKRPRPKKKRLPDRTMPPEDEVNG